MFRLYLWAPGIAKFIFDPDEVYYDSEIWNRYIRRKDEYYGTIPGRVSRADLRRLDDWLCAELLLKSPYYV